MDGVVPAAEAPTDTTEPFALFRPPRQTVPIVFTSPHSGRDYPAEFLAAARLDPLGLRRSEDSFVDELFSAAPTHGAPLLAATFPRAFCDPNREAWELDPGMFEDPLPDWVNIASPRVGAGLGTIARVVASGEPIYRGKLRFAEAERRVHRYWQRFHAELASLIASTRAQFGCCLLIDCHSMPSGSAEGRGRVEFVLGDAHGTTCTPPMTRLAERLIAERGHAVRRNDPYAGGFITRHYGRPRDRVQALQIEIARHLYMDEVRIEKLPGFEAMQAEIAAIIAGLARRVPALLGG